MSLLSVTFSNGWRFQRRRSKVGADESRFGWRVFEPKSGVVIAAGFTPKRRLPIEASRHINHGRAIKQPREFEIVPASITVEPEKPVKAAEYRIKYRYNSMVYWRYMLQGKKHARFDTREDAEKYSDRIHMLPGEEREITDC